MKILLLYNGYPRVSQTYQIDEANELNKNHQLKIYSWNWDIFFASEDALSYVFKNPLNDLQTIKEFNPDLIIAHYLINIELCVSLSNVINKPFIIRTHSFDILEDVKSLSKYKKYVDSPYCKKILCFPFFKSLLENSEFDKTKLYPVYPSINIERYWIDNGLIRTNSIMSGGALLPKKNIEDFIVLT
jgi:hypothetical protein